MICGHCCARPCSSSNQTQLTNKSYMGSPILPGSQRRTRNPRGCATDPAMRRNANFVLQSSSYEKARGIQTSKQWT